MLDQGRLHADGERVEKIIDNRSATTDANEDELGKVDTETQPDPKPASREPVESEESAHANDDD